MSGDLTLSTGDATGGKAGDITVGVGASSGFVGGNVNVIAGTSDTGTGGNVYLKPGNGSSDGSIYLVDPTTGSNFGVVSKSTFDFTGQSTASISTTSNIDFTAASVLTLQGNAGIDMGDSHVYGFQKGTATVGSSIPGEIALHTMTGVLFSGIPDLGAGVVESFQVVNTKVTSASVVTLTVRGDGGCEPVVIKCLPAANTFYVKVKNMGESACTSSYSLSFAVWS